MCFACTPKVMKLKVSMCLTIQAEQYNFMEMNTFRTRSVTQTDKYLAILPTIIHFPLPEARDFLVFFFPGVLSGGLKTTSRSHINTCSLGSRDMKPTPSLTRDWRKLSLISPTETDSTAPCAYYKSIDYITIDRGLITEIIIKTLNGINTEYGNQLKKIDSRFRS